MQPLPEKVTAIGALEPPKDIEKLRHFLGLVGFYMKFMPLFVDVTACLKTMLWEGAVFMWTEQCGNAFKLLKSELVKCPCYNIQIPIGHLNCSLMHLNIVIWVSCTKKRHPINQVQKSILFPLHTFQVPLVGPNSCGTPPRKSVTWSTNPLKSLHFI